MPTNSDGTMPFIQNSDLFWLSGIDQEESILIIHFNKSKNLFEELLFLKETNEHIAIWEGEKLSKKNAYIVSGIKIEENNYISETLITHKSTNLKKIIKSKNEIDE